MASKGRPADAQAEWDAAEVADLADRFDAAIARQEALRLDVARLTGELKKAKQRLKDGGYVVASAASALRRAVAKRRDRGETNGTAS